MISQREIEERIGKRLDPKLVFLLVGDDLYGRIDAATWVQYDADPSDAAARMTR